LSCLIHAVAGRTLPAGERGSAAGSPRKYPLPGYPNYTWTCVLCRPHHPSCPLTLSGSSVGQRGILCSIHLSVLYLQHILCSYLDALQHLPPPQPVPCQASKRSPVLSICLLARGAARPRCIVAPGVPLERPPPGVVFFWPGALDKGCLQRVPASPSCFGGRLCWACHSQHPKFRGLRCIISRAGYISSD
jgi:hypothetical protein